MLIGLSGQHLVTAPTALVAMEVPNSELGLATIHHLLMVEPTALQVDWSILPM